MGPNPKPTVPHETSTFESTCLVDTGDPVQYYYYLSLSHTHHFMSWNAFTQPKKVKASMFFSSFWVVADGC